MDRLYFLKLGGSLITDKTQAQTPRQDLMDDIARQIAAARQSDPGLRMVLGHGSGSFGHPAASRFHTRQGVSGSEAWHGFAEVWFQASSLNRMVMESLRRTGLPAVALAPVAAVTARDGRISGWDLTPIQSALANDLLPVVYGDVIFDSQRGGTILSTEDLFIHLAHNLHPQRILLAGMEKGVWSDFPARTDLLRRITPAELRLRKNTWGLAGGDDVTGGMKTKVESMMALVEEMPGLEVFIFSGVEPGSILQALRGETSGTCLHR